MAYRLRLLTSSYRIHFQYFIDQSINSEITSGKVAQESASRRWTDARGSPIITWSVVQIGRSGSWIRLVVIKFPISVKRIRHLSFLFNALIGFGALSLVLFRIYKKMSLNT